MKTQLLVFDNHHSGQLARATLESRYEFIYAPSDIKKITALMAHKDIRLAILHSDYKNTDYLKMLSYIKKSHNLPVIIIMDENKQSIDNIIALETGADELIAKPFEYRELIAKIRAILRLVDTVKNNPAPVTLSTNQADIACFNDWMLDLTNYTLHNATKKAPKLTLAEYKLLTALISQPRIVITRNTLVNLVHGHKYAVNDRSIDILIGRLRKKLDNHQNPESLIKTIRGVGYMLNTDVQYHKTLPQYSHQQLRFCF